ncbi:MAG: hypothetical protein RLZZ245_2548 [Verrucomicrobiota bacterium]|jgi:hypothetical protein
MKAIALPLGILALVGTIVPPLLFLVHKIEADPMKNIMLVACFLWFITAPMWMKSE